jgi:hypothetical protein
MQLTTKVPHPSYPDFLVAISHISRTDILKNAAKVEKAKRPYIVKDPDTNQPVIVNGEPVIVWKVDVSENYAIDNIRTYVVGFEGHPDGIAFSLETLDTLLDPKFDVEIDREVEENGAKVTKKVKTSWAAALERKAYDRKSFDSDPLAKSSATP